ncbi:TIGR00730 family Rossman fold protein [Vagococcus humatus]|uniref:Cytokinin riboside 5'-monophosphate phosphoribohydrolase n=1 Tax=Vagococcus humatus TaxID=1889241 RepID=A0A429Z7N1_9ENTE|nr:TIGR00730 family Rossman fold protein [Vagococcus humatus]RST89688.1 TIGR00730 family Rossman fold protein [Vagococcus humatus]
MKNIAVYCGSSPGNQPIYAKAATELGQWLVQHQLGLVYGGSKIGLMGKLAQTVLNQQGFVLGVMPQHLANKEIALEGLSEFISVPDMHTRKKIMMDRSDGFIALPGGCGTMEEIFEVITWSQIGLHQKPFAFYNVAGYYDFLGNFLDYMVKEGFTKKELREAIFISDSLSDIYQHFQHTGTPLEKDFSKVSTLF